MAAYATRMQTVLGKLKTSVETGVNADLDSDLCDALLVYMQAVAADMEERLPKG